MSKRSRKTQNSKPAPEADIKAPDGPPIWVAISLIALAIAVVYSPALRAPFLFDDKVSVVQNPSIRSIWPLVGSAGQPGPLNPPPDLPTSGRPLVNLSFAANYAFGQLDPTGYHLVNIVIHFGCTLLVWALVRRTLRLPYFRGAFDATAGWIALVTALLWALHPLQTEAVVYATQRTELMVSLFYLATMYCSLRYWESQSSVWLALAIAACAAGMASKEVMVSAPVVVLLFDRTFVSGSLKNCWRQSWRLYAGLAATWIVLAIVLAGAPHGKSAAFGLGVGAYEWWLTQTKVFWIYVKLALWPSPLLLHYEVPYLRTFSEAWMYAVPLVLVGIAVLVLLWRNSPIGFLGAFAFAILAPTFVVPIVVENAAERRMYLPLLAVLILLGVLIKRILDRMLRGEPRKQNASANVSGARKVLVGSGLVLAAIFGLISQKRAVEYYDEGRLWHEVLDVYPNDALAHDNLGEHLYKLKDLQGAISEFQLSIQLRPDYPIPLTNLGAALVDTGQPSAAIDYFKRAIALRSDLPEAHNNLGRLLTTMGRLPEAENELRAALALTPDDPVVLNNLGIAFASGGKLAEAITYTKRAVELRPDMVDAHNTLGIAYVRSGKTAEALAEFRMARSLKPNDVNSTTNLAMFLADSGQWNEAIELLQQAIRLDPRRADLQLKLANTLARAGRSQEAIGMYQNMLTQQPQFLAAYSELARLLGSEKRFADAITVARKGAETARALKDSKSSERFDEQIRSFQSQTEGKQ